MDEIWMLIQDEARADVKREPSLKKLYYKAILQHKTLELSITFYLASKLHTSNTFPQKTLRNFFLKTLNSNPEIRSSIRADLIAAVTRDPACTKMVYCFLYYKGFHAIQVYRIAHDLFLHGQPSLAYLLQSRCSEVFSVDIHPGARIGKGILLDHGTGVVIGETAIVGDDVEILHGVTLGGTGKEFGMNRHPRVGNRVLIGAGASVLGNVRIGDGAKIGAGAVVVKPVPDGTTVVGAPAKVVFKPMTNEETTVRALTEVTVETLPDEETTVGAPAEMVVKRIRDGTTVMRTLEKAMIKPFHNIVTFFRTLTKVLDGKRRDLPAKSMNHTLYGHERSRKCIFFFKSLIWATEITRYIFV